MSRRILRYSFVLVLIGLCNGIYAQADVYFIDRNDNATIPGVWIDLNGIGVFVADAEGHIRIPALHFSDIDSVCGDVKMLGYVPRHVCFNMTRQTFQLEALDHSMNPVVITAQHHQVRADQSIHRMRVIDRKRIDQLAAVNLEDVLRQEVNMQIGQDAMLGSNLSIQGLNSANVKILVDGVPVIGRLDGAVDLKQINMSNVERIEIVQGPLSVQFGSDAIAGTVNIITRTPVEKRAFDFRYSSQGESVGIWNNSISATARKGRIYVGVDAFRNQFDGWTNGEKPTDTFRPWIADSSRFKTWKPRLQQSVSVYAGTRSNKNESQIKYSLFNETLINRGLPRGPFGESAFDENYLTRRSDIQGSYNRIWKPSLKSQQVFAFNDYRRIRQTYLTDLTSLGQLTVNSEGAQDTTRFRLYMSRGSLYYNPRNSWYSFEAGYDLNHETMAGRRIEGTTRYQTDVAVYSSMVARLGKGFSVKPAFRVGYNSSFKTPFIPSINFLREWKSASARLSYARGFRAPALKELYFYFVDINHDIRGSEMLKAESSHQFQGHVSAKKEFRGYFIRIDFSGFYNTVSNLITLAQVENTLYTYINAGSVTTYGGNVEASVFRGNWKTSLSFASTNRVQELNLNWLEGAGSLTWTATNQKFNAQVFTRILGGIPSYVQTTDAQYDLVKGEGYQLIDFNFQYRWKSCAFTAGVKNLLDVTRISSAASGSVHGSAGGQTLVSTGRNYFISLSYHLNRL